MNTASDKNSLGKRILILAFLIFIIAIIISTFGGCQSESSKSGSEMVSYQRSGGIAGLVDHLAIDNNGHCVLQGKTIAREFDLSPDDLTQLRQLFEEANFFTLNSEYLPADIGADRIEYIVTYRVPDEEHTVRTMDGAVPEALAPILSQLNRIISDNAK